MSKKRKIKKLVVAAICIMVLLAGCGNTKKDFINKDFFKLYVEQTAKKLDHEELILSNELSYNEKGTKGYKWIINPHIEMITAVDKKDNIDRLMIVSVNPTKETFKQLICLYYISINCFNKTENIAEIMEQLSINNINPQNLPTQKTYIKDKVKYAFMVEENFKSIVFIIER